MSPYQIGLTVFPSPTQNITFGGSTLKNWSLLRPWTIFVDRQSDKNCIDKPRFEKGS